ncbi:MAG: 2-C-methyl-D-erythritol 4-phosphate cytidylyltransferase [Acidimicrobiia bacterium]|nr:2-C-methyl-D-erythritol 4-phosphate cytidylyltransferase [Acidimicrobiia bacterium]
MSVWVVVVAGGSGTRFGGAKQFAALGDVRVVDHSVRAARTCGRVVLVVPASGRSVPPHPGSGTGPRADLVVEGASTRTGSVRAGLAHVPADAEVIVVHDAARPLAHAALFRAVVEGVRAGAAGAVPGLPVSDTLKRVEGDRVVATVDRSGLVAVQTPQAFDAGALRRAHAGHGDATDDAALIEDDGGRVVVVPGDPFNIKITAPADLEIAEALLGRRAAEWATGR